MKNSGYKAVIIVMVCLVNFVHAQTFTNYTTNEGLPDNNVNGVAIDTSDVKWFGTQAGVAKFNDTTFTVYTTANGLIDNYINCIAADKNNNVWAGTDYGVSRFDGSQMDILYHCKWIN